jgi:hypothetical protein
MLTFVSSSPRLSRRSVAALAPVDSAPTRRSQSSSSSAAVAKSLATDSFTPAPGRAGVPRVATRSSARR